MAIDSAMEKGTAAQSRSVTLVREVYLNAFTIQWLACVSMNARSAYRAGVRLLELVPWGVRPVESGGEEGGGGAGSVNPVP